MLFNVQLCCNSNVMALEADGFKTVDNGALVIYETDEDGRNTTIFVAGPGRWDYFEPA